MTPKEAANLRILDPACGSGSFLIGAYQFLLDWHRDRYVADDPERHARGRNPDALSQRSRTVETDDRRAETDPVETTFSAWTSTPRPSR